MVGFTAQWLQSQANTYLGKYLPRIRSDAPVSRYQHISVLRYLPVCVVAYEIDGLDGLDLTTNDSRKNLVIFLKLCA